MGALRNNPIVKFSVAVLLVVAVLSIVLLRLEFNSLKTQRDELAASIASLEDNIGQLKNSLASEMDDDYVIGIAKDKLNLRLPNEVIFYNDLTD